MVNRRGRSRGSALESLEARSLLSVAAPLQSTHIVPPAGGRAADIDSPATERTPGHTGMSTVDEDALSAPVRTGRSGLADPASSPPSRNNPTADGAARRASPAGRNAHDFPDPLSLIRHNEPATSTDSTADEPEATAGPGGVALEVAGSAYLVGWAPGPAPTVVPSLVSSSDPIVGLDVHSSPGPGSRAAVTAPSPVLADIAPEFEGLASASASTPVAMEIPGEALHALRIIAASSEGGTPERAWAELLDGALDGDWDGVDQDLRRFLARLDGRPDAPEGSGAGPTWPIWIAAMTAVLLARRASQQGRRRSGRLVPALAWATARPLIPVGPWPLGSP